MRKIVLISFLLVGCVSIARQEVLAVRPSKPKIHVEQLDENYAKISIEDLKKLNDYLFELEGYADKLKNLVK